jgi:hypothetical protein
MASTIQVDKIQDTGGNTILSSNSTGTFTYNGIAASAIDSGTLAIAQGGTGAATLAAAGLSNTPAFHAYLSSNQTSISGNSNTKVQINTEVLDTDSAYDNSTNYRFTPQSAGKYFVYANLVGEFDTDKLFIIQSKIFKNGSVVATGNADFATDSVTKISQYTSTIVDMNGSSDYVEFYGLLQTQD